MKVSIIGGGGRVGSTAAFSLLSRGLVSEVVLIDIARERAQGEALDIAHALSAMGVEATVVGGDDYSMTEDSDLVLITAGVARKPGMSRLDLADSNIKIIKDVVPKALEHSKNPFIFVVSNPVDVLTYYALKVSGLKPERVFGLGTLLDTVRMKSMLRLRLGIEYGEEVMIIGEHGDSMTPVFSHLNTSHSREELWKIFEEVRDGAAKVIESKGATWFAPAVAIAQVVEALQKSGTLLPLSVYIPEHDVCIGYPAEVSRDGVKIANYTLSPEEEERFLNSVSVIKKVLHR